MPSGLTGVQCTDLELVLQAFDHLLQTAVQVACDYIDVGSSAENAEDPARRAMLRSLNVSLLNKAPLVCARLRGVARTDTRYAAVMYYERTRLGATESGHFLEALPAGLPLFSGASTVVLQDSDLRKLKSRDVMADRRSTIANLEKLGNSSPNLQRLVHDYQLRDAPAALPGRVHVFLARQRAVCQGLKRVKPACHFKQCRNGECRRLFYCGAAAESAPQDPEAEQLPSPAADTLVYWDLAAGSVSPESARQGDFCTWACWVHWQRQLDAALPSTASADMLADDSCRKTGRARVSEALRACSKRNEAASRHLRTIEKQQRTFGALGKGELQQQRARHVRMLNVDLGLLYATSIVAESKGMSLHRVLAGASQGWRSRPAFYAKGLKEVGRYYDKYHKGGSIVSNMLVHEPFFAKLRGAAARMF